MGGGWLLGAGDDDVVVAAELAGDESAFAGARRASSGSCGCLDALDGRARGVLPHHVAVPSDPSVALPRRTDIAWLQPFPDRLWEPVAPSEALPDA